MRIAFGRAGIEANHLQELTRAIECYLGLGAGSDRAVGDDVADLAARIERGERILKDHLDAVAFGAQRLAGKPGEIGIADPHRAAVRLDQSHHQPRHRGFAGAGFADEAERLAFEDREVDLTRGVDPAVLAEPAA